MTPRTVIRNAFAALLTGLPSVGTRVFQSRSRPLAAAELPAILVFSGEATGEADNVCSLRPDLMRYQLRADILVKDSTGIEALADQILDEICNAVFASPTANTLSGQVCGIRLVQIGEPDLDDVLEKPALRLPVLFETTYSTT